MSGWACGIAGCGSGFETADDLIRHQVREHGQCECAVCGESHPAGYLAIKHVFENHTRAEFVRAYDADSDDIREREEIIEVVEDEVDVPSLLAQLDVDAEDTAVSAGD